MFRFGVIAKLVTTMCFAAAWAMGSAAQSQPDSQAGAQLGEQSALAGKQAQGANTQKTTETSASGATSLVAGTAISAELTGSLDSRKLKQGDAVNARTTDALKSSDGRTILPKGTKITGHVTQASVKSATQASSSLGLIFDTAILKNGEQMPLNVAIQAIGAPPSSADASQGAFDAPIGASPREAGRGTMTGGGSGAPGTLNNTAAVAGNTVDNTVNSTAGVAGNTAGTVNGAGQLNANNRGVVGLHGLSLNAAEGSGAQGSVITSTGKNVHLDSGTRLLLVAQATT